MRTKWLFLRKENRDLEIRILELLEKMLENFVFALRNGKSRPSPNIDGSCDDLFKLTLTLSCMAANGTGKNLVVFELVLIR